MPDERKLPILNFTQRPGHEFAGLSLRLPVKRSSTLRLPLPMLNSFVRPDTDIAEFGATRSGPAQQPLRPQGGDFETVDVDLARRGIRLAHQFCSRSSSKFQRFPIAALRVCAFDTVWVYRPTATPFPGIFLFRSGSSPEAARPDLASTRRDPAIPIPDFRWRTGDAGFQSDPARCTALIGNRWRRRL